MIKDYKKREPEPEPGSEQFFKYVSSFALGFLAMMILDLIMRL